MLSSVRGWHRASPFQRSLVVAMAEAAPRRRDERLPWRVALPLILLAAIAGWIAILAIVAFGWVM